MRKNLHAVALGRKGGRVNSKAQQAARLSNIAKGGRPKMYRIINGDLYRYRYSSVADDQWLLLHEPYDAAAIAFLRRQQR